MKRLLTILIAIAALIAVPTEAVVKTGWRVSSASGLTSTAYSLTVKKIDYRKELTRVYCTIAGRANTSSRITSISFGGKNATDIDGIDLNRYFQFEESGKIDLEIDFPPMKPQSKTTLKFVTKGGTYIYTLRR